MTKTIPLGLPRRGGALQGDGTGVETRVTESLLREFLTLLDAAQEELNQRWNRQRNSDCHTGRM